MANMDENPTVGDPSSLNMPATLPAITNIFTPSPTRSYDSGISFNQKASTIAEEKLPLIVETKSSMGGGFRSPSKQHTTLSETTQPTGYYETISHFNTEPMPYQARNFRSSTMIRIVPIAKRHLQTFGDRTVELYKTKQVPFHAQPFLWDPDIPNPGLTIPLFEGQRTKFKREEEHLEEVRGQKRKREQLSQLVHKEGCSSDLQIGGKMINFKERYAYKEEVDKLKGINNILPKYARDLYTGKGIKFSMQHSSNFVRKNKYFEQYLQNKDNPKNEPEITSPVIARSITNIDQKTTLNSNNSVSQTNKIFPPKFKRHSTVIGGGLKVGRNISTKKKNSIDHSSIKIEPYTQMQIQNNSVANIQIDMETEQASIKDLPATIEETAMQQQDHATLDIEMKDAVDIEEEGTREEEKPATGTVSTSPPYKTETPNPLKASDLTLNIAKDIRDQLNKQFAKLDKDKDGHITFPELQTIFPEELTKGQQKFIKQVYDITSSNTFFGEEEFVMVTFVCQALINLNTVLKDSYNKVDQSQLKEAISHYVEMFASVDRKHTGSISILSLQGILIMALDKDLKTTESATFHQILHDLDKTLEGSIDKVDYLASLPYFMQYKSN